MDTLIDTLLSMEGEAGAVIERARAEAANLEKQAEADIAAARKEVLSTADRRIDAFREEVARKYETAAALQKTECVATLKALAEIPGDRISMQVEKIVARFREI